MMEKKKLLLDVHHLSTLFPIKQTLFEKMQKKPEKYIQAVSDIDLHIAKGETVGLVGESGCGKSTLAKTLIRLNTPVSGSIEFQGIGDLSKAGKKELKQMHKKIQMIFQDPYSSLNPRMTIRAMFYEILSVYHLCEKSEYESRTKKILAMAGMPEDVLDRRPSDFSGGQRQRIGIARALVMNPELLIADEPVSALDMSIQAQIINLLTELKQKLNLTMLFISHDLRVVRYISDRVVVMYLGKIVEEGTTECLFTAPMHPYTDILIHAAPIMNPEAGARQYTIEGETPSPIDVPAGCRFHPRCPLACDLCRQKEPKLMVVGEKDGALHKVACHFPLNHENELGKNKQE